MNWNGSDLEPRLLHPSFANTYFSALPFALLHDYRRQARTTHVSDVHAPAKHVQMSLVQNLPMVAYRKKGSTGYTYG